MAWEIRGVSWLVQTVLLTVLIIIFTAIAATIVPW